MERPRQGETIMDRHNKTIAAIMKRFLNMIAAATEKLPESATIEAAQLNRMRMETESAALIAEIQNMLSITREIKALWIKGPIRKPGEDDKREEDLDKKAEAIQDMYNQVMALRAANERKMVQAMFKGMSVSDGDTKGADQDVEMGEGDGLEAEK